MVPSRGVTLGGSGNVGGNVSVDPGGILAPGNSPGTIIVGSLALAASANLLIEIGGTVQGASYDSVNVLGNATLGGNLIIVLINGFTLSPGNIFMILSAGGGITADSDPAREYDETMQKGTGLRHAVACYLESAAAAIGSGLNPPRDR